MEAFLNHSQPGEYLAEGLNTTLEGLIRVTVLELIHKRQETQVIVSQHLSLKILHILRLFIEMQRRQGSLRYICKYTHTH